MVNLPSEPAVIVVPAVGYTVSVLGTSIHTYSFPLESVITRPSLSVLSPSILVGANPDGIVTPLYSVSSKFNSASACASFLCSSIDTLSVSSFASTALCIIPF